MIDVENLTKTYGQIRAVDNITFKVDQGDILGFLGPNGAGKTTTMRMLTGFFPPNGGRARVADYDVVADSIEVRRRIGYLPERVPLYLEMNVRRYLAFVHELKGYAGRRRRQEVNSAIEQCGLAAVSSRIIGNLSSGFRQRVGLAQALIGDPRVLVLDEPTIGLDPAQVIDIRRLIKGMAHKKTIILSTHILSEVSMICNKVIIINRGRIARQGDLDSLDMEDPSRLHVSLSGPQEEAERLLADVPNVARVELEESKPGDALSFRVTTRRDVDVRAEIAAAVIKAGYPLLELRSAMPTLEEMFLEAISDVKVKGGKADAA